MTSNDERAQEHAARDGARRLAKVIRNVDAKAKAALGTGLVLPVLDADPDFNDSPTVWLLSDGRMRFYLPNGTVQQVTSAATGSATSAVTTPTDPSPERMMQIYAATGAVTICDTHGAEAGSRLNYGQDDGQHGNRRIIIMFDAPTIQAALADGVIRSVELSMYNTDAHQPDGVEVSFGTHAQVTLPSTFLANRRNVFTDDWPLVGTGQEWRVAPTWIGEQMRDGGVTGLTIDQPAGLPYLGEMEWASVRLRIGWTV